MMFDGWFVVQTNPQQEKKADAEIRRLGLRVYLPKRTVEVKNRKAHGETKMRFKPLLIGYLFVRFPDSTLDRWGRPPLGLLRGCEGVRGYVRAANEFGEWEPIAIPDELIADFMRRQRRREFGRPAVVDRKKRLGDMRKTFVQGSSVRVTDGPFAGFLASLEKLNDDMTVTVEFSLFGRATTARLSVEDVEQESTASLARAREAA